MDFASARRQMVEAQLRTNKIVDPLLLAAMNDLPREKFVSKPYASMAYADESMPVGRERLMMEPLGLARLLQAAEIKPEDVVLDIGCATGYSAAVLSRLANTVVALEADGDLAKTAEKTLSGLGIDTVAVVEGAFEQGYPRQAPYDVIIFEGALAEIPQVALDQLAEGGRLVAVVQSHPPERPSGGGFGTGTLVVRSGGILSRRHLFEIGIPFLPGFEPRPAFTF